jgi:putative membrane protein
MSDLALGLVIFVAVAHVWFMVLESVLWTRPFGRKTFGQSREDAAKTKVLAMNQGIYNGGVAALLLWAAFDHQYPTVDALLIFIIAMGVVGGVTAKPIIIVLQAVPAALALAARHL